MKKILALLLTLAMLLSLAACGGKDDPNAGTYRAVSCTALGFSLDCEGDWLELKGNGKGSICLMGEEYNCKWTLEGETFTLTNHVDEFKGTLHNGMITLDFGDMIYVYLMDAVEMEDGSVRGHIHQWQEADCVNSAYCSDCGEKKGEPLGHDATQANYQTESTCVRCGEVLAEKLQPDMEKYGITEFMEVGVVYPYATVTYRDETLETVGELMIVSHDVIKGSEEYPEREGYVWHLVEVQAEFFDRNAIRKGVSVGLCYEDYYTIDLSDDSYSYDEETKESSRLINYHGEEVPIYYREKGDWTGWKTFENGRYQTRYCLTRAWQVPEGYDGSVVGFFNEFSVFWDDKHIYEVYDPAQFLLFRLN